MDINALGAQYLDQPYVPFSGKPASGSSGLSGGQGSFAGLLEKARAPENARDGGAALPAPRKTEINKEDKLYEMCMELETFLIKNLIKGMRGTVQKTNLIDTGFAGEVYEDMLYDEYAASYAKNAGFGFAEMAYRELSGMEQTPGPVPR